MFVLGTAGFLLSCLPSLRFRDDKSSPFPVFRRVRRFSSASQSWSDCSRLSIVFGYDWRIVNAKSRIRFLPGADFILNGWCSFWERLTFSYPVFLLSLRFRDDRTSAVTVPSIKPLKKIILTVADIITMTEPSASARICRNTPLMFICEVSCECPWPWPCSEGSGGAVGTGGT
jgi:hypothetical protein